MNPESGSGMNIPDHISESLETIFWVKILKFFDVEPDPGSRIRNLFEPGSVMEKFVSGIRDKGPGPATLLKSTLYDLYIINNNIEKSLT
jgi:hypothetical protein